MSDGDRHDLPPTNTIARDESASRTNALQDWVTLWQSELAAMAADREMQESWQALLALWAGAANAMLRTPDPRRARPRHAADGSNGQSRTAAATGAAAAAAASDARDVEIARLHERIAGLEQRLGDLERGPNGTNGPRNRRRRRNV